MIFWCDLHIFGTIHGVFYMKGMGLDRLVCCKRVHSPVELWFDAIQTSEEIMSQDTECGLLLRFDFTPISTLQCLQNMGSHLK